MAAGDHGAAGWTIQRRQSRPRSEERRTKEYPSFLRRSRSRSHGEIYLVALLEIYSDFLFGYRARGIAAQRANAGHNGESPGVRVGI